MNKIWLILPLSLLIVAFRSRGDRPAAEKVFARTAELINEMSDVLRDAKSVKEARPKLENVMTRIEENAAEGKRILVPRSQMLEIQKKFNDDFRNARQRFERERSALIGRDRQGAGELQAILARFIDLMERK
jgi:hypothetical protein